MGGDSYAVGFTGTRKGMTDAQMNTVRKLLEQLQPTRFHHGNCVGADEQSHVLAQAVGAELHGHPCDIPSLQSKRCAFDVLHPTRKPLERNRDIVRMADYLIAAPEGPERVQSGTWSTVRYAKKIGREFVVIMPDGLAA